MDLAKGNLQLTGEATPCAAAELMLSILFEMLASSAVDTRVHAFNLLFNLVLHINLIMDVSVVDLAEPRGSKKPFISYFICRIQSDKLSDTASS